jgi:hypothetical protein
MGIIGSHVDLTSLSLSTSRRNAVPNGGGAKPDQKLNNATSAGPRFTRSGAAGRHSSPQLQHTSGSEIELHVNSRKSIRTATILDDGLIGRGSRSARECPSTPIVEAKLEVLAEEGAI